MALSVSTIVFWLIAIMTTGSAVVVAAARNILHAAFALCTAFLGVGALYVFLHADFVAAVQLIVYVGGILVLIMFAVMFSSNVVEDTAKERRSLAGLVSGLIVAIAIFVMILLLIQRLEKPLNAQNQYAAVDYANTVGVQPDPRTAAELAADNALLVKFDALLNPPAETAVNKSASRLSNDDLRARLNKALGDKPGAEVYAAWDRQRGRYGLGHKLIGEYLLPFEVASILLLAALLGAVVVVRKELS